MIDHEEQSNEISPLLDATRVLLTITRGGSSLSESEYDDDGDTEYDNDDDIDDDDDDVNDGEKTKLSKHQQRNNDPEDLQLQPNQNNIVTLVGKAIAETARSISRAIKAGIDAVVLAPANEEEETSSGAMNPLQKTFHVLSCMVKAALDKKYKMYNWNQVQEVSPNKKKKTVHGHRGKKGKRHDADLTQYLCQAYSVQLQSLEEEEDGMDTSQSQAQSHVTIMGGSLTDALSKARSQARLLVVYIPSSKPGDKKKQKHDIMAIQSLLSRQVFQMAEKNALPNRSKGQQEDISSQSAGGSFVFWSTKYDSKEKVSAMKRLKVKTIGSSSKNPILMVVYPYAAPTLNALGQVPIIPRVLAQHHCNPPPGKKSLVEWLNSLRKRHRKQYAKMQHDLVELELFRERERGYQSSIKDDRVREEREKEKRRIEAEQEKAEKQRKQEIIQRRKELQDSLGDEPDKDMEGVVTVAVRFSDGGRGQRRFNGEKLVDQVFNWIDVAFEIERETFDLVTMNGKKSFTFGQQEGVSLEDTGLGKMFALRVIKKEQKKLD
eukprot:CAMPEP_0176490472 /NCGR_PEP_ID=MMETSP0200_2-20121128/7888_1 /TAXON_ID=947934 /ORGANISM="Chaetoceros sp., Strain GSL56" /LENGTH=546 /DNA_ID=CAMNT_0017887779 /DNA_START=138 /DNA_END=1775 /DNA_ORIENTATION=-